MLKKAVFIAIIYLFFPIFPLKAIAETVLQRIDRTGELRVGTRKDAIPFSYLDSKTGQWTGYGFELTKLIQRRLETRLHKPVKLTVVESNLDSRFRQIEAGKTDISCNAATITEERLQTVDFSIPYFITGAQFLVRSDNIAKVNINGTLKGISIAYLANTTTADILRQIYPFADWRVVSDRAEGVTKLKKGEVKAIVSDGILLVGEIVRQGGNPRQFALMPRQPITTELYGCILPKNDPEWKNLVDSVIGSEENRRLRERWFNVKKSAFPYTILSEP
ncbi:amino acid ABC transporter substrate-binding protein [Pannus brasiliensis CCIBt3594]|uniref:Amino acid ABC transporter substrate-binding protein n=1 Tax=Pannus brasiliensis CCIBt3594 TaxID=1427578 RepID=A0AAW9R0T7_9CHRO